MFDMVEMSNRLVLRYEPGQFSFRHFTPTATDEQLFDLAEQLNAFQADEVKQIVRVSVRQLM